MSRELANVASTAVSFSNSIAQAMEFVRSIHSKSDAEDVKKRIDLAKEWARIEKVSRGIRVDLALLEVTYLRRVVEIGEKKILGKSYQGVAAWWAEQPETLLRGLIESHIDETSSVKTIKEAIEYGETRTKNYGYVRSLGLYRDQGQSDDLHGPDGYSVQRMSEEIDEALMAIVQRWSRDQEEGFTINDLVEEVIEAVSFDSWPGMHDALSALCREAILKAPVHLVGDAKLPAFVTCRDRRDEGPAAGETLWIRVPIDFATLRQFKDMVDLRQRQADDARRTFERLENQYHDLLSAAEGSADDPLSALVVDAASRVSEAVAS